MTITSAQCWRCKHYKADSECAAFVDIPPEIYTNKHDHTTPYPGDNGIRFEPIDEEDAPADG